jgi:hypothetical protein
MRVPRCGPVEGNWKSGLGQIEALLNAAEAADKVVAEVESRKAKLESDIERLGKSGKQYVESVKAVQAKLAGYAADLASREAAAKAKLDAIKRESEWGADGCASAAVNKGGSVFGSRTRRQRSHAPAAPWVGTWTAKL